MCASLEKKYNMKKYKHIFFDLDRTIWDFDENSKETLREIYNKYQLSNHFIDFIQFCNTYHANNDKLWTEYREGKLKKEVLISLRFYNTLLEVNVKNQKLAHLIGNDYVKISPTKKNVFPYTYGALNYLKEKKYKLYIITNGFNEVQFVKMKNCNLNTYFSRVITGENAGSYKPNSKIFHFALSSVHAKKSESIMIGDDLEVDIQGASDAGIDQVYFNPDNIPHNGEITFEISSLKELMEIF